MRGTQLVADLLVPVAAGFDLAIAPFDDALLLYERSQMSREALAHRLVFMGIG